MTALIFDPATQHLPPGRTRMAFDEAEAARVRDPMFASSSTRPGLWRGLQDYLFGFAALEQRYAAELTAEPLVHFLWLGGSFVSPELDPRNVDVTVCVDAENRSRLRGRPGSGWMNDAFTRRKMLPLFGVSSLEMLYHPVASVFEMHKLNAAERFYLQSRGAWDDWWQRCRIPGQGEPSAESAQTRRGYVEVIL